MSLPCYFYKSTRCETEYRAVHCYKCAYKHKLQRVDTYYCKRTDLVFAVTFVIEDSEDKKLIVESYFIESPAYEHNDGAGNSIIYADRGSVSIVGHPFTLENVTQKAKLYLLMS